MHRFEFEHSTGIASIDATLQAIIGAFEHAFPNRVQAYYLIGSYVEQTAVPLSDIDCFVVFRDTFVTVDEEAQAQRVGQQCAGASPVRLDISAIAEQSLVAIHPVIRVALKQGSLLVRGSDIRQDIPLPPFPEYTAGMIEGAQYFIARLRGATTLPAGRVEYPNSADLFFGYTSKSIPAWYPPTIQAGTKELVATVSRIAAATVVQHTSCYIPGKHAAIMLFQHHIGGIWAPFVQQVFARCKVKWHYLIPEASHERQELHHLCQQMLMFENTFLQGDLSHDT